MRCSPKAGQAGFTLIEALTAGLALSILAIGLSGLWASAGASVTGLVVREKAIWALNAQMERLAALYQFTDFRATGGTETSNGYGYPAAYADDRLIFSDAANLSMVPPGTPDAEKTAAAEANAIIETPAAFAGEPGMPVAYFDSISAAERRNYIWVDRDRGLVGRLSWDEQDIVVNRCDADNQPESGASPCLCLAYDGDPAAGGAPCREIILTLEFPFRWDAAANDVVDFSDDKEILSLRTIVGRRL